MRRSSRSTTSRWSWPRTNCRWRRRWFRYALFECRRGAAPDLDAGDSRAVLGRTMGRLHVAGGRRGFASRPRLDDGDAGSAAVEAVLDSDLLDPAMRAPYERVARDCVAAIDRQLGAAGALREIRLHGDCHLGNLLWNARGPVFVDLDDCLMGPAMQDLWMLVAGDARQQQRDWAALIEGYETFASFDFREVALIEALRTLRMIRHASWLAARWNDPAFPPAFPWFAGRRYWETHVSELREQLELIEDPPLLRML
jgi:Ser/Thr protein kinase RdoA (MazF antagonist)